MSRRDLDIRVSSADELEIFSDFMALSAMASLLVFSLSPENTEVAALAIKLVNE